MSAAAAAVLLLAFFAWPSASRVSGEDQLLTRSVAKSADDSARTPVTTPGTPPPTPSVALQSRPVVPSDALDLAGATAPQTPDLPARAAPPALVLATPRVTILDAFALARRLKADQPADANLDINHDGVVDRGDVDALAMAAVRLEGGS